MEIPLAFGLSLAENGWVIVCFDEYENHDSTRLFPTKQKLVEFLLSRMEEYEVEYDVMLEEFEQHKRDEEPGKGFPEEESLPQCFAGLVVNEDLKESDASYNKLKETGRLEKPKKVLAENKSKAIEEVSKNPWWKIWARK